METSFGAGRPARQCADYGRETRCLLQGRWEQPLHRGLMRGFGAGLAVQRPLRACDVHFNRPRAQGQLTRDLLVCLPCGDAPQYFELSQRQLVIRRRRSRMRHAEEGPHFVDEPRPGGLIRKGPVVPSLKWNEARPGMSEASRRPCAK